MSSTKAPKPKTRTVRLNFFVSPGEIEDMRAMPERYGAESTPLVRTALRIIDERKEPVERIDAEQARSVHTAILCTPADAALVDRIARRNKCTKADVIRYALRALRDRGLRFG